jgi:hypothetical protein
MILIKLQGGLGNQLFQYSLGLCLAIKNNTELVLDVKDIKLYAHGKRDYSLSSFNTIGRIATEDDLKSFKLSTINKFKNLFRPYYRKSIVEEKYFNFDYHILEIKSPAYISGFSYWRSEKYFKEIEGTIRKSLTLKNPQNSIFNKIKEEITNSNSVSLHVRRTDYLMKKHQAIYTQCTPEYYYNALKLINSKYPNSKVFVFSDDIIWAKENLNLNSSAVYVSDSKLADYQELILMSTCKNNIIANSTFSWWGAWLNDNIDKVVISPKKWHVDTKIDERDLIPKSWIKI